MQRGIVNAEGPTGPTENIHSDEGEGEPLRRQNSACSVHCACKFSAGDDDRPAGTMTGSGAKLLAAP
jgi:hypothetical protein